MRRLARRLFTSCSAVSLLLCVAVCVLWVRSYRGADHLWLSYRPGSDDLLRTDAGDFTFYRSKSTWPIAWVKGRSRYKYEVGPLVGSHPDPGAYPVQWRWGPLSYAATRPPPPPTSRELQRLQDVLKAWDNVRQQQPSPRAGRQETLRRTRLQFEARVAAAELAAGGSYHWQLVFPAWLLIAVTLPLPLWEAKAVLRTLRERRCLRAGLCPTCGYDLRASLGRCPECGASNAGLPSL
jgi:hypothetical protein